MNDISVGAVGAAVIAGLVSLLGLIIGKEQKVSEFRQAWIDELRKCLISYLSNINAISDILALERAGSGRNNDLFMATYKALNEANHGIIFRINSDEPPAKALLESMSKFEAAAGARSTLTVENIRVLEEIFVKHSKELLKFEWNRVKRGEDIFVLTKRIVFAATAAMICLFIYYQLNGIGSVNNEKVKAESAMQNLSVRTSCDFHASGNSRGHRVRGREGPPHQENGTKDPVSSNAVAPSVNAKK